MLIRFTISVLLVLIFISTRHSFSQESNTNDILTLKKLSDITSNPDNPEKIKLRLNSKKSNYFASTSLKGFSSSGDHFFSRQYLAKFMNENFETKFSSYNVKTRKENFIQPDTYIPWESRKHFWLAAGEGLFFNVFIPWSLARYTRDWDSPDAGERWPFIGWKSINSNLKAGWNYDGDNFLTNMFSHPYGGNLFFNSGRSNGFNFWESSAFALAGSYLWETFMETNQPAINDWVNTGVDGAAFGEVLYRLSVLTTDNTARGSHRVWTEIGGAFLNPVRFFTRLVTGELSRVFPNPSWRKASDIKLSLNAGTRVLLENDPTHNEGNKKLQGLFELTIDYGDDYRKHFTPFSNFEYNLTFASSYPSLTSMNIAGSLFSFELSSNKNTKHYLETSLNYNYLNNPGFLYGNASIVEQLNSLFKTKNGLDIRTKVGIRLIPMGGTPNDYFYDSVDGRSYDFGQGLGAVGRVSLNKGNWDILTIHYVMDYIWTQSQPSFSKHLLQGGEIYVQLPLKDYFVFGVAAGYYKRKSYYYYPQGYYGYNIPGMPETNAPDVSFQTPILRVFFKTRIL